jgi:hypothetical protein
MPSLHERAHAGELTSTRPSIELVHEHDVRSYFDEYARALTSGDGVAIAALWDVPGLLLGEGGVRSVRTADEIANVLVGVRGMYALRGIVDTRPDIQRVDWLTDRIVAVRVRWPLFDDLHHELGSTSSVYTLIRDRAGALRLRVVVMLGEAEPSGH